VTEDAPILLACDGSSTAQLATATVARLFRDRRAVVVTVWTPAPGFRPHDAFDAYHGIPAPTREALDQHLQRHAEQTAAEAEQMGTDAGLDITSMVRSSSDVAETLAEIADSLGAAAIVVGTNDHGLFHVLPLGRVTRKLADSTHVPLLLLPGPTRAQLDAEAALRPPVQTDS
jgi:nucleotide-binding universal stress UspA family protein